MKKLLEAMASLEWWVSVFVAGFLINVVGHYFLRWLDNTLDRFSSKRRKRREREEAERLETIDALRRYPHGQVMLRLSLIYTRTLQIRTQITASLLVLTTLNLYLTRADDTPTWVSIPLAVLLLFAVVNANFLPILDARSTDKLWDTIRESWTARGEETGDDTE